MAALLAFALWVPTAAYAEISFTDSSAPVQEGPVGINASDCNGDGRPDLIVANQISNSVTILRNRGDGTLVFSKTLAATTVTAPTATPAGPTPTGPTPTPTATANPTIDEVGVSSAVCGDFTGDKLADVAFVNRGFNKVTIRRKEDNGDFTLVSSLPVGGRPTWVSTIDLNHDDHLDLVVLNSQTDDLTILRGNGAGDFPFSSTIHIPDTGQTSRPVTAALADFNGDTHIDIMVGIQTSPFTGNPSLTLLLGNGDGSFHPFDGALPATGRVKSIATDDFNGDDIPDLAVLAGDTSVVFFTGTGTGTFQPFGAFAIPASTPDLALADFNDDDKVDLALAYYKTNDVQVLLATGPAAFVTPSRFRAADQDFASSIFFNSSNAAALRSSANGAQLLTFDKQTPAIDVLDFTNANAMTTTAIVPLTAQPESLLLGDFNNDALPDAVVGTKGRRGIALQILPGTGNGGYGPAASGISTCGNGIPEGAELCDDGNLKNRDGCSNTCQIEIGRKLLSIAAGDVNGDHNQDLVIVGASSYVLVLIGDGQGHFTQVQKLVKVRTKTPGAVGDFTGDGFLDIATIPFSSRVHGISLLVNDGTGVFTPVALASTLRLTGPFLSGDIDGDGLLDLVAASKASDGGAVVLANDGGGPNVVAATLGAGKGVTALAAADFDEDGALDILVSSSSKTRPFSLFRGLGDGTYGAGQPRFVGQKPAAATIFDANEDVHQDVVLCDATVVPPCRVQYGDGAGQFSTSAVESPSFIGRDLRAIATGDFDDDGAIDFVGVSRKDATVAVLFRAGASTPQATVKLATGNKPRAVAVGDLNGDLLPDIVVANGGSDDLSMFINGGNRQFTALTRVKLPKRGSIQGDNPSAVELVDLNGDQKLDVVVSQEASGDLARLLNLGVDVGHDGNLVAIETLVVGAGPVDLAVGLLNGDAVPDFVTANSVLGSLTVLLSDVGGYVSTTVDSGGLQPSGVALADLDGDLDLDLIAINAQTNNVVTFLNDGAGAFTFKKSSQVRGRHNPQDLCIGDFDFDDTADVAIASPGTKDIFVLRGKGDGTWEADERVYQVAKDPVAVACTFVDDDEKSDIVFGRRGGGDIDFIKTAD